MERGEASQMPRRDLVVIGCSSGGLDALKILVSALRPDLPAAVLIVQHVLPDSRSLLPEILNRFSGLPAKTADDGEIFEAGKIYVAAPDHHLVVAGDQLRLTRTARENRSRPSVDALFRTAATSQGGRVIGVILTGNLDDGAAGLKAVKECGGMAIVQDPSDAAYRGMPESALRFVSPDHIVPIVKLGELLNKLAGQDVEEGAPAGFSLDSESRMETTMVSNARAVEDIGTLVSVTCPDCGGPLWEIEDQPAPRFRCHTGHSFGLESLVAGYSDVTERSLWTALRVMDEKTRTLERLASDHKERGHKGSAGSFERRALESREHAEQIRRFLTGQP